MTRAAAFSLASIAAAVTLAPIAPASANDSYAWGTNGSGACIVLPANAPSYVPTNCMAIVGPWWAFDGYAHISSKSVSCSSEYYTSLQALNGETGYNSDTVNKQGIAYQTTDDDFTWDGMTASFYGINLGTATSPGNGVISLDNWNPATRHVQGAVGCVSGGAPVAPSGTTAVKPKAGYDFGAWEKVVRKGKRRTVLKQIMLEEGKRQEFRLLCPQGWERTGGLDHSVGHAMTQRPNAQVAATTDVGLSALPARRGARVTLKPRTLPYPTVVQFAMSCQKEAD